MSAPAKKNPNRATTAKGSKPKGDSAKTGRRVRVLSSRVVYRAPVFYVTSEQIVEPSGANVRRDMVHHPGSVVIMAVEGDGDASRVLLARQFRYAAGEDLWEFPAGRIDEGEDELAAAKRELEEETGYSGGKWKRALFFYSSPGFLDETMAVYLATELRRGKAKPEEDEFISKRLFPVSTAVGMVMNGKIRDGKTIAGVLWLSESLRRNG
ncbi:MAG TPA: NUDIX hydrolase [Clostridia bacterium]|nr:NUDIX hydrolase [Clostridia bacterium]